MSKKKDVNILVVGGAGFIGTRLCKRLSLNGGCTFNILDKLKSEAFPERSIICDIEDLNALRDEVSSDVDVIVNLAAEHKDNVTPVSRYADVNVTGQENICKVMQEKKIERHIFTSSVAIYGFVSKETLEDGDYAPFHAYGRSKLDAERVLDRWFGLGNTQHSVIRPTVVFGEGNRGNVYNLLRQIASGRFLMIGSGRNRKSMAYVENVAAFIEFLIVNGDGHQVFNYSDKPDFNMNELYKEVNEALGLKASAFRLPYLIGLVVGYGFDVLSKITGREFAVSSIRIKKFCGTTQFGSGYISDSGFSAPIPLHKGLRDTVKSEFGSR